jgi:hypothetical protein
VPASAGAEDDDSIGNYDRLLRRLHPTQVIFDRNRQQWRSSSAAFLPDPDGLSILLSSVLSDMKLPETACVEGYDDDYSAVVVPVGEIRAMEPALGVVRDPDPPDVEPHVTSPAHGLVIGIPSGRPGRAVCKHLALVVVTEFVDGLAPLGIEEQLAAWAERWNMTRDDLQDVARRIVEAVDFTQLVNELEPDLRVAVEGGAGAELMEIVRTFGPREPK